MLKIAHFSDPHFASLQWSFQQFLSKEWLGNLNLLLFRRRTHLPALLHNIGNWLQQRAVEYIFFAGDFTTTSSEKELILAEEFIEKLKQNFSVYCIPGNHDKYTRQAELQQSFYRHFAKFLPPQPILPALPYSLPTHGVQVASLREGWWWVGLDTIISTPIFASWGLLSSATEQYLDESLQALSGERVILVNHYPLFTVDSQRRSLKRNEQLQKLLQKHRHVKLYLHGHTHQQRIIDHREQGLPLSLDSGSCSHRKHGSFYLITVHDQYCEIAAVRSHLIREAEAGAPICNWQVQPQQRFEFN